MKVWIAVDKDNTPWLYSEKPYKCGGCWIANEKAFMEIITPEAALYLVGKEISYEDEPILISSPKRTDMFFNIAIEKLKEVNTISINDCIKVLKMIQYFINND